MDLEVKYGKKFKIFIDDAYRAESSPNKSAERWRYLELRGKYGYVYPYSQTQLAIAITGPKIAAKFLRRGGWKIIQDGEDATVFLIPEEDLGVAFITLKLLKKKVLSDEDRAKKIAVLAAARAAKKAADK